MVRVLPALLLALLLGSAAARAASPQPGEVSLKGFVVARPEGGITVRHGDGSVVTVALTPATVVAGVRAAAPEIALRDLVRVEGTREPGGRIVARRVDVVLAAEGLSRSRPTYSVFWNWVVNGSLSLPLP